MNATALAALAALTSPAAAALQNDGPGLGNLAYDSSELFQAIDVVQSANGHSGATIVNGYLFLVDVGDNNLAKGIEFWDVSDPRDATLAFRHEQGEIQALREAKVGSFTTSYGADHVALLASQGVQIWDVTDPAAIVLESYLQLPNLPSASYGSIWWLFWQAPYLYVAGTSAGLYVAKVEDVRAPQFVKLIPPSQLAGLAPNQVFACGNLIVLTRSKELGFVTLDASDPENPFVLQRIDGALGYSHVFAAGKILTSGGDGGPVQMFVHDVAPDGIMSLVGSVGSGFSNGAYGSYQDGYFHSGMSNVYAKFDVGALQVVGTGSTGIVNRDEDFAQVLGNVVFVGDDHAVGSGLYVHDVLPDSRGPEVHWVHPMDGAQNVAETTRVGLSLSDNVAFESVNGATLVVRPLGAAALPGRHSVQMGLVGFAPDSPLQPNTVYEVVLDGIEDLVGNRGPVFRSTFATGSTSGIPPATPVAVTGLSAASGKPYRTGAMTGGALKYIDRDYAYASFPSRFQGHTYLLTANDDKFGVGAVWTSFEVAEPAEVNVLFDDRATSLPAWLSTWTPTGENADGLDVYRRDVPAGTVTLGGNANAPMQGAESMYGVVVLPSVKPPTCGPPQVAPTRTDEPATLLAGTVTGTPPFTYSWSFGDGTPATAPSPDPSATHVYGEPGRYPVVLTVENAQGSTACSAIQIVHDPLTPSLPAAASTIVHDGVRVLNVNPDNDSVTALDAVTLEKLWESAVGGRPRTLALAPDGSLWVVCQEDASVHRLDPASGTLLGTAALPRGSRPFGVVFRPDGAAAYVSLEGGTAVSPASAPASPGGGSRPRPGARRGRLAFVGPPILAHLLELDPGSAELRRTLVLGGKARGLAVSHDSRRLFVARFVSPHPERTGLVHEVDTTSFTVVAEHRLRFDPGPDTERSGRGVPNYLGSLALSPDGERLLVPSKKDNTERGLFRDGQPLTFESRTRTIVSQIDLVLGAEDEAARLDLNDRDMAQAVAWSPLGDLFVVAAQGSNTVEVFEAETQSHLATLPVGRAPQGLVFAADGSRLFVHSFLSRAVTVYDTRELVAGVHYNPPRIGDVATVASEALAPAVLNGKRIFYDASDRRMNLDGYVSCASCHLDGGSDGQVWDLTQVGEGLRNTIPLVGRAGTGHGNVHWTANFDEIQDFENDVRDGFAGAGFLLDPDFQATEDPLGPPKAGLSSDLDDLAAFVASLDAFPASPFRRADGSLTPLARAGRAVFERQACASCHSGPSFTDGQRHDVGTVLPPSGSGSGQPLAGLGFETPTLRGLAGSAPYLHDGRAATLEEALVGAQHAGMDGLSAGERAALAAYLLQIE